MLIPSTIIQEEANADLQNCIDELRHFVKTFDAVIKTSAAHIYVSAMTFCPRSWPLNDDIECSNRLAFSFPLEIAWDLLVADMQEQQSDTITYWPNAISPDGTRVAAIS